MVESAPHDRKRLLPKTANASEPARKANKPICAVNPPSRAVAICSGIAIAAEGKSCKEIVSEELNSIRIQRAKHQPNIVRSSLAHEFFASPTVVRTFAKQRTLQSLPLHGFDNTIEYIRKS
jgi:hypothetical protein